MPVTKYLIMQNGCNIMTERPEHRVVRVQHSPTHVAGDVSRLKIHGSIMFSIVEIMYNLPIHYPSGADHFRWIGRPGNDGSPPWPDGLPGRTPDRLLFGGIWWKVSDRILEPLTDSYSWSIGPSSTNLGLDFLGRTIKGFSFWIAFLH